MKKILSMVLTLSIVLGTIGIPVFAEEVTSSAKIGVESFATLSDALSAASSMSDEVVGVTTPSGTTEVTGKVTYAYVSTNANTPIWGEGGGNASESLEFKLYEGEKEIAVTKLNNVDGIIDGNVYVTWNFFVKNTDEYWTTKWAEGYPKASMQPDTVKVFVDGVEAGSNAVKLNAPDDLNKIVAAAEDENGFIGYFTTPADAIKAAAPAGTVELLTDVTVDEWVMFAESLSISNGQLITLVIDGMTINGNGNTLTVNSIESANNGGRLFYDATSLNINDLTIKCADGVSGGIGLKSGITKGVTFEGGVYGVLPGEGDVTIEGCTFNTNGTSIYFEDERDNLIVTGNTFNNANDANVILLRGDVQFKNNVVNSGRTVNIVSGSPVVAGNDFNDVRLKVYPTATATVSNNEINNLVFEDAENETTSIFTGNTLSETAQAALDAVTAKTTGLSGSGTKEDPYLINNYDELNWFADDVNSGNSYEGKTVVLASDIDLNYNAVVIGTKANPFKGTFDGKNHTISNLNIYENGSDSDYFADSDDCVGLFGVINTPAAVKNVTVDNPFIVGSAYVAAIVGMAYTGTIDNCHVTGEIDIKGYYMVGGITGHGYAKISNCSVIGDVDWEYSFIGATYKESDLEGDNVGGIVGHNAENNSITNCTVENVTVSGTRKVGGIVGITAQNGDVIDCSIKNVTVETTATAEYAEDNAKTMSIGGLIGQYQSSGNNDGVVTGNSISTLTFANTNKVTVSAGAVSGGLRGSSSATVTPAETITVSGNTIKNVTGATVTYLEPAEKTPCGSLGKMYVQAAKTSGNDSDRNRIYGEILDVYAKESIVVKVYSGETLIGTTTLNSEKYSFPYEANQLGVNMVISGSTSSSWNTVWEEGMPRADFVPDKAEFYLDGNLANTANVTLNGIDNLGTPTVWEALPGVAAAPQTGLSGSGTEEDPYLINNLAELEWFRDKVDEQAADGSTQFAGKYFKLTDDIDLLGINWNPIGSMTGDHGSFKGVFDGDGHTISNLSIDVSDSKGIGFFAYTTNSAEIKNLTFNNININAVGKTHVGGVVGDAFANTKITNVHITGSVNIKAKAYIGAIVGHGYVVVDNSSVKAEGTIDGSMWCVGGIVGYAGEGTTNVMNSSVEGIGNGLIIQSAAGGLGSIVGMAEDNNGTQPISGSNLFAKNIDIKTYVGGYGIAYADYALGYLYGGNPTSKLTGELRVENVIFETSTGETTPKVADAIASIGSNVYFNFLSAIAAAADGETITLLSDATPVLTSQREITKASTIDLNGNTLTLKEDDLYFGTTTFKNGTIIVDPSVKPSTAVFWMFANQSLTFDNVKVVASGVTGTYLIGLDGNNSDLNIINGSEIIIENDTALDLDVICVNASIGNDILIENSKINVKNLDGRVLFRGNYTISGNSELYLDGITKAGIRIEAGQILAINDNASVTITGEPRDGGIHLTDATAGYTKADTATVNATINKPWDGVTISNLAELKMFRDAVNNGDTYKGKTVTLTADIDLVNENWTPIGSPEKLFLGTFDGGNHTISNLVIEGGSNSNQGFFGVTQEGEIKNLTINNAKVTGRLNVGVLAGTPYTSKYTNIKLTGHVEVNGFAYVGGVGGKNAYANWTDITVAVDGTSYVKAVSTENGKAYRTYVGGVIGFMGEGGHKVSNVTSNINVFGDVCDIGGIAGIAHYGNTFENCKATGKVECENAEETEVGGIAGVWHNEKGYTVTFTNCKYEGSSAVSAVGAPYLTSQTSSETSGTLLIDGVQAWPVTGVAQIGSTKYKSISEALEAATNGETVTLLGDVEVSESLVVAKGSVIAIDLNGFTISRNQTEKATGNDQLIQNNGTLTIKDSSETATGKLVYNYTGEAVNNVSLSTVSNNCATLIVESGTIENASDATGRSAAGTYMYAVDSLTNSNLGEASVTVNGGVIKSNYMAIRQFVNSTTDRNALVVTDGEIIAEKRAINVQGSNNETKASNAAELNISGGIIKVTSDESSYSVCNLTKSENVAITGGTFIGAIWSSRDNVISGGTFNVEPDAVYAADGYEFVANEDGTYGVQEVVEEELIEFSQINMKLGNDLSMMFYVLKEDITDTDSYAIITKEYADGRENVVKTVPYADWEIGNTEYRFAFNGIAAKEMVDNLNVVIYNSQGEAISEALNTSVKDYVELMFAEYEGYDNLAVNMVKTTLVDMLNYGATAQKEFGYNTSNFANAELTDVQKSWATEVVTYKDSYVWGEHLNTISLSLNSNIVLNFYFENLASDSYVEISYKDHYGKEDVKYTLNASQLETDGTLWKVAVDTLVVADYQTDVTCTVYNADGSVYDTATCSMDTYCSLAQDEISAGIMKFASSAYTYLHR